MLSFQSKIETSHNLARQNVVVGGVLATDGEKKQKQNIFRA